LELGWDEPYGGLRLALDIDGEESPFWRNADCKPWWVQVEALVATAYAYRHTRSDWCLQWHDRVQQYAFSHYPVATGEWTQWLDRQGRKTTSAALPVKDPFHLPRALMELLRIFETHAGGEKRIVVPT
jgi:N-acylglucosamine 2-epimerase